MNVDKVMQPMEDKLQVLADTIANKPMPFYGNVPYGPVITHRIEDVTSITWMRSEDMQVQLFAVPPNYVIPEHTHPNVDSYELLVGGDIKFSKDGDWVKDTDATTTSFFSGMSNLHPMRGSIIRIHPDTPHGGVFGPRGGVFMSIQQWLNGVPPHCVSYDYDGLVMGDDHLEGVVEGNAKSKGGQTNLTWRDAASKATVPPSFEPLKLKDEQSD